jgi:hypothetical protein
MVIIELNTKDTKKTFLEIKRILAAAKQWKITTKIEITVLDGQIQLVGQGFVKELNALTTGSCKLVIGVLHWFELVDAIKESMIKIVVSEGEAMVGRVTVNVATTFFETDKILRSISLPANPKAIDYWKLEYQGYSTEELQFNCVDYRIENAKKEFEDCIRMAAMNLNPFRISKEELKQMILKKMREKEKVDFQI